MSMNDGPCSYVTVNTKEQVRHLCMEASSERCADKRTDEPTAKHTKTAVYRLVGVVYIIVH